jgi:hypothetical protein
VLVCPSALAGGVVHQPASGAADGDPAATVASSSASFSLQVQAVRSPRRARTCRSGRQVLGVGPSLVVHGTLNPLRQDCSSCCQEYLIFEDDFESGGHSNWSSVIGG